MKVKWAVAILLVTLAAASPRVAARSNCIFTNNAGTMTLTGDCVTTDTIFIPNGATMDLGGFTIQAVDPAGGHFLGAVIRNSGTVAHLTNGVITAGSLASVCDAGDDRLRGIMFDGASGSIIDVTVESLNQGASGCQEGNAVEVRNLPFDGTHPGTVTVEIAHNHLSNWQKTGIVANGDVDVRIHHNTINPSATQANLAANSVQIGFGGKGLVENNHIAGNSWCCSAEVGTAILLFEASAGTIVRRNEIMDGNADVGIWVEANGVTIDNNKIFETGDDTNISGTDIGLGNYGSNNVITNNKSKGFAMPYDGVIGGKNKAIPSRQ
jgi:hypothetical protein